MAEAPSDDRDESLDESLSQDDLYTNATKVLINFRLWLTSPDGGKNDQKTASQHAREVTTLLDYKLIRDRFITEYAEKNYNPKTIKSYIMSVCHFSIISIPILFLIN